MADLTAPQVTPVFGVPTGATQVRTDLTPQVSAVAGQPAGITPEDAAWKQRHSGVAGVARSILGGLGDFLLSHLGMAPLYANSQKQHELNYAFDQGGNSSDPAQQLNAANQVQKVDFDEGTRLKNTITDNARQQQVADQTVALRQEQIQRAKDQARDLVLKTAAQGMNNVILNPDLASQTKGYAAQRALWDNSTYIQRNPEVRQELESLYPKTYDPETTANSSSQYTTISSQWANALAKQKLALQGDLGQQKVDEAARNHDLQHGDRVSGQGVTMRGQDIRSGDAAAGRAAADVRLGKRLNAGPTTTTTNGVVTLPDGTKKTYQGTRTTVKGGSAPAGWNVTRTK